MYCPCIWREQPLCRSRWHLAGEEKIECQWTKRECTRQRYRPEQMDTEEDRIRVVVMGDTRVGKSAILTRFLYNTIKVCLRAYDLQLSTPMSFLV
jgi:hypothetical protein